MSLLRMRVMRHSDRPVALRKPIQTRPDRVEIVAEETDCTFFRFHSHSLRNLLVTDASSFTNIHG